MKTIISTIIVMVFIIIAQSSYGQAPERYYSLISKQLDSAQLSGHLRFISSDLMEGRETGTEGMEKAAAYITKNLKRYGLKQVDGAPNYLQEVVLSDVDIERTSLTVGGTEYEHYTDFVTSAWPNREINSSYSKFYFTGYGIEDGRYNDYRRGNFKGKAIMIYKGEPVDNDGNPLLSEDGEKSMWTGEIFEKLKIARSHGVEMVFIIDPTIQRTAQFVRRMNLGNRLQPGKIDLEESEYPSFMFISPDMAKKMCGEKYDDVIARRDKARETMKPKRLKIKNDVSVLIDATVNLTKSANIAAVFKGKNGLDKPYLILSAHYDHLGKRGDGIYNGADDNGTGTSALLSMAQTFSEAQFRGDTLEQSILFLWFTGEEKGLLGSRYYVNNPLVSLENASADINIDMIGRRDEAHQEGDYIYVIGADKISTELDADVTKAHKKHFGNKAKDFRLDYTFNDENDPNRFYYRSDHYNFAQAGIPIVFFFSGVHEDYHMVTDTYEKILFNLYSQRTKFIARLVVDAASKKEKYVRDVE